jgi:hypothetical protein
MIWKPDYTGRLQLVELRQLTADGYALTSVRSICMGARVFG